MSSHQDFVKNNSAERYILHQLEGKEELSYEEHLLFCNICLEEVQRLSQTREVINEFAISNDNVLTINPNNTSKDSQIRFYIRIAASVLIIIAVSWVVLVYLGAKKGSEERLIAQKEDSLKPKKQTISLDNDTSKKIQVADHYEDTNYKEYPSFETLVGQEYRTDGIDVVSPGNSSNFKIGEKIIFRWLKKDIKMLNLAIFDNKGKIVFEQQVAPTFTFKSQLAPGLYYWQLETESEAIYTGKFAIK